MSLRIFGREPSVEDWRCVGRWHYAAAWLADDLATARAFVRARLGGAAEIATTAAMGAGRGDADRFLLVSALARLPEAIHEGGGSLGTVAERAIEETALALYEEGAALRGATKRERAAFAPRFSLESFDAAMHEVGIDRHVVLRELAAQLDEALLETKADAPCLRTMRLFLAATLCLDSADVGGAFERAPTGWGEDRVAALACLLTADLALTARRSAAYEAAWASAVRVSTDGLSRILAALTSGAAQANNVVAAIGEDPWALVLALAMTTQPEHASALLDWGVLAQGERRARAAKSVALWAQQTMRIEDMERRMSIEIAASVEDRQGHETLAVGGLDLFGLWNAIRVTEEARAALTLATESSLAAEAGRRRDAVKKAKTSLETVREAYESVLEAAKATHQRKVETEDASFEEKVGDGSGPQKGCVYGFGAGCSVVATYVVIGVIVGTGGMMGKIGPAVMAIAAVPVAAAIVVQVAYAIRRSAALAEAEGKRKAAMSELERARGIADREHGTALKDRRLHLEEVEESLGAFERLLASSLRTAA